MIIEWMIELGVTLFDVIFALLGVLPQMPEQGVAALDFVFNLMFDAVALAGIFIDFSFVKLLIPLAIAIFNFDHIVKFVMFILKKIPILGIE
mgnify:CR=1 FL=1